MIPLLFYLEILRNVQIPLSKTYIIIWEGHKEARKALNVVNRKLSKNAVKTGIFQSIDILFSNETHIKADFQS